MNHEIDNNLALAIAQVLFSEKWSNEEYLQIVKSNEWLQKETINYIEKHVDIARKMINYKNKKDRQKSNETEETPESKSEEAKSDQG